MGLMEPGCTRRDFGRDVQPAVPNRPRCWSLVGSTFGAISNTGAESTQHHPNFFLQAFVGLVVITMRLLLIDWRAACQARGVMIRSGSLFISGCRFSPAEGRPLS